MKNKKLFAILTLVCFMFTLMPVAAFAAGTADADASYIYTVKKNPSVTLDTTTNTATANVTLDLLCADGVTTASAADIVLWVTEEGKTTPSSALDAVNFVNADGTVGAAFDETATVAGIFDENVAYNETIQLTFVREGVYTIHAALGTIVAQSNLADATDELAKLGQLNTDSEYKTITVDKKDSKTSTYVADIYVNGTLVVADVADNGKVAGKVGVAANSIDKDTIKVVIKDNGSVLKRTDVEVTTSSDSIAVSEGEKMTTGSKGYIEFNVTGETEGTYYIYITVGSYEARVEVVVGAYDAAYIETDKQPSAPVDVDTDLNGKVTFIITDINGNELAGSFAGATGANTNDVAPEKGQYVKIVTKPAASTLKAADLTLVYENGAYTLDGTVDAEGTYEFKVLLDNGKAAYATVEVKEFQSPVKLVLTYKQEAVELGGTAVIDKLQYVDANGVTIDADDVVLAANGYAVFSFEDDSASTDFGDVVVENNEKYVGSEITVIAVSERYNMTATATIKVTADAAKLQFADAVAEVDVNNKIDIQLVDSEGNKVAPTNMGKADISYIIVDQPEDAKVSVFTAKDTNLATKGVFTMSLTSNKVGNVTVQAIAKLTSTAGVVKYYTGVGVIPVGMENTGDVVVMSIGSNELVVNNEIKEIPAPAVIKDARTFVPFRAIGEAFGAEVAWDAATQSVTAELNGVTVVLTIGSPVYTVNGVEYTADVAPYIAGDGYTMVPARLIAEAFGGEVLFTTDANGATADVLFLM